MSIPKDKDSGRNKSFGFVTYKHLSSVEYALYIFAGSKLHGKELLLKNRNRNPSGPQQNQRQPQMSLMFGYAGSAATAMEPLQQQLIQLATGQSSIQNYLGNSAQMQPLTNSQHYSSTRSDSLGSQRDHYVDRSRYHREDARSNRSKPYRRSRSRTPPRNRDRSPQDHGRNKAGRNRNESGGYHRWGKR